jgi:hypothetical protein
MSAGAESSETKVGDAGSNLASAPDKQTLQAELAGERDRYLRLAADFDDFRKRTGGKPSEMQLPKRKLSFAIYCRPLTISNARLVARARPHPNNSGKASG